LIALVGIAACTLSRDGSLEQTCSSIVDCDDGTACTEDVCSPEGLCRHAPIDGSASIEQVAFDCKQIVCENGREKGELDDNDVPSDVCIDYVCNEGELVQGNKPPGTLCNEGQGSGTCQNGSCVIVCDPDDASWVEICDDQNDCTIDSCDAVSKSCMRQELDNQESTTPDDPGNCRINLCVDGEEFENEVDNTDLPDDGEFCTDDQCDNGDPLFDPLVTDTVCSTGFCDGGGECVQCNQATQCPGQDTFCQVRTCNNHACGFSNTPNNTPLPSVDQTAGPCKEIQCNGLGGTKVVNRPDNTSCSDGVFCNGTDTCLAGDCNVHAGNPCPGPDSDGDCSESCNETNDNCSAADPNGSACTDGLFCNGTDTCGAGTCSLHTGNPCPGPDGDGDCAESCSESNDNCLAPDPNGAACTDSVFCNGTDTCNAGACAAHAGNPCPGPDGDGNCSESCNETNDNCLAPDPNGSACNDSLFCNGADTCNGGSCSIHPGDPCPGPDGDGNCSESCNETNDNCLLADPNGSACTDGLFCNGTDTCGGGTCSVHTGSPCPGPDGDGNCAESCNETNDNCLASDPNNSACIDGVFCNGTDACSGGTCTLHTGNPCPGPDGDGNCAESCDETNDNCLLADPNGSACSDGLFCNGADTCGAGTCSVHPGDPCPGPDGDGDCAESCNEAADMCTANDPDGTSCGQVQICATGMCVSGCGSDLLPVGGVQCPAGCNSCDLANRICFIDCIAGNACQSMTLACPADWACEVSCSGNASCQGAIISCPSLYACDITCSANGACSGLTVDCPTEGTCNLACTSGNGNTCQNAVLDCLTSLNECTAACSVGGPVTANCPVSGMCSCSGCP